MTSAIKNMNYYKRKNNVQKLVLLGDMLRVRKKIKKTSQSIINYN